MPDRNVVRSWLFWLLSWSVYLLNPSAPPIPRPHIGERWLNAASRCERLVSLIFSNPTITLQLAILSTGISFWRLLLLSDAIVITVAVNALAGVSIWGNSLIQTQKVMNYFGNSHTACSPLKTVIPIEAIDNLYWSLMDRWQQLFLTRSDLYILTIGGPQCAPRLAFPVVIHGLGSCFAFTPDSPQTMTSWQRFQLFHSFAEATTSSAMAVDIGSRQLHFYVYLVWLATLATWQVESMAITLMTAIAYLALAIFWDVLPNAFRERRLLHFRLADEFAMSMMSNHELAECRAVFNAYELVDARFDREVSDTLRVRRLLTFERAINSEERSGLRAGETHRFQKAIVNILAAISFAIIGENLTRGKIILVTVISLLPCLVAVALLVFNTATEESMLRQYGTSSLRYSKT